MIKQLMILDEVMAVAQFRDGGILVEGMGMGYLGSRLHGKDCSYNPFAFPPSMEVRRRRYEPCNPHGRGEVGQRRSSCRDGRRYESKDGRGRAKQDARAENNAGARLQGRRS